MCYKNQEKSSRYQENEDKKSFDLIAQSFDGNSNSHEEVC